MRSSAPALKAVLGRVAKPTIHPSPLVPASAQSLAADGLSKESLAWGVRRTANGWLPVYTDFKSGRSRIVTLIRRIDGDLEALRRDLGRELVPEERIAIKPLQRHIVLRGNYISVVRDWLTNRNF
ncbi:MAG: hypothetical protein SGCHY_001991 [Lobulomycetales sp.]